MTKNLSQRVVMSRPNCASRLTSSSDGFSARIRRRRSGSARRLALRGDAKAVNFAA